MSQQEKVGQVWAEYSGWKGRGSIGQLAATLEEQRKTMHDYVCDTRRLGLERGESGGPVLKVDFEELGDGEFPLSEHAFAQLAQRCSVPVPTKFAKNLWQEQSDNCAMLINAQNATAPKTHLVRTMQGNCRAVVSNKYRIIDNYDLAAIALEIAGKQNLHVLEATLDDARMRIKFTAPEIVEQIDEARLGGVDGWFSKGVGSPDMLRRVAAGSIGPMPGTGFESSGNLTDPGIVWPLITVSNSETGQGGLHVRSGICRAFCFNLATVETIVSKSHLGQRLGVGELSRETIGKQNEALISELRDVMTAVCSPAKFRALCDKLRGSASVEVPSVAGAVDNVIRLCELNGAHRDGLLQTLIEGYTGSTGYTNGYGLAQAVSRYSQDLTQPDEVEQWEIASGSVLQDAPKFADV